MIRKVADMFGRFAMKSFRSKEAATLLALLFSVLIGGCVIATKKTVLAPEIISLFEGTYTVDPYMEKHRPLSVAVLPFYNVAKSQKGSDAVRRGFYNHFSSLPFKDMEITRIDDLLMKADLSDPEQIKNTSPQKLGEILGVDAVVYGEISNFDKLFAVMYSQISVGAEIKMFDTKTGNFLWSGQHVVRVHEGGISVSPVGIIATVIATAMNVRDIQLLRACDDLFREMVKTIPTPPVAAVLKPPTITLLVQDTKNLPKKAGDEIRVVLQGTPKMRAQFSIGNFKKYIDMQEQEGDPGSYYGVYRVVPGDNVFGAIITGYLTDDAGNKAEWVDALGTVIIDTTPPDKVTGLKTVGRDKLVLLSWNKAGAADLAGYRLYRSATPLSGFQEVAKTEFNEIRDGVPENGARYYYQISAVDRAGNESEMSGTVSGLPVAPGPTPVSGAIEADITWYAGASPYVIENDVVVRDKAILTIEPGTEVLSRGGALVVEGRLQAQGDGEHLIQFAAAEGVERWAGIRFANVKEKENSVKFIRVRKAIVAITCEASSPRIEACELTDNDTALAIVGAFSAPVVTGNTIHKNTQAAVIISDGAKPTLSNNGIQDNDSEGIVVRSAAPDILNNAITKNRGGGILVLGAQANVRENNLTDNGPFDLKGEMTGESVSALNNWWGSTQGLDVFARISGRVDVRSILDAPYPEGKPMDLPIMDSTVTGSINADGFMILSHSPYRVTGEVTVSDGAVLTIEPGVVVQYDRNTSIIIEDGGVVARGKMELPITFTSSGASPAPGSYTNAFRLAKQTKANSVFSFCIVEYATTAFDIYYGTPEISSCYIARNAQNGIYCRNDSAPQISYCTFEENFGGGGINFVGMSNPSIHYCNFLNNAVSVQGFSSILVDARNNWWGADPPDTSLIWAEQDKNINLKPWLTAPEEKAFSAKK